MTNQKLEPFLHTASARTPKYPLALIILLVFGRFILIKASWYDENTFVRADSEMNIIRQSALVISYLMAFFTILMNFSSSIKIFFKTWPLYILIALVIFSFLWAIYPRGTMHFFLYISSSALVSVAAAISCAGSSRHLYFAIYISCIITIVVSTLLALFLPSYGVVYLGTSLRYEFIPRWKGIAGHPNELGAACCVCVWAAFACRSMSTSRVKRFLFLGSAAFAFYVTAFGCKSMTSSIASVTIAMFFLFFKPARFKPVKAIIYVLLVAVLFSFFLSPILNFIGREATFSGRTILWDLGFNLFMERPLFGFGFDRYVHAQYHIASFHNGYIEMLVTGGIIGFFIFAILLLSIIYCIHAVKNLDPRAGFVFFGILLLCCICNMAESLFFALNYTWVALMAVWAHNILWLSCQKNK